MLFYLGTHMDGWLSKTAVPLFISARRLKRRKSLPRALGRWALDSGGFTELSTYGRWTIPAKDYVAEARRFRDEVGQLDWAAQQDWMCEPFILEKTGKGIAEHQQRTVDNLLELRALAPDVHWVPVVQGWKMPDYLDHVDQWARAGVDLTAEPVVGLGSVCRRQAMDEATDIVGALSDLGLRLHGFGFKLTGLRSVGGMMHSADSMAWSYNARRNPPLPGHTHKSCANCLEWALRWRALALAAVGVTSLGAQRSFAWI